MIQTNYTNTQNCSAIVLDLRRVVIQTHYITQGRSCRSCVTSRSRLRRAEA
ncbi:hypothetical protein HMPREF1578_01208, partial [Gardnerella pickettii JCP8017B]